MPRPGDTLVLDAWSLAGSEPSVEELYAYQWFKDGEALPGSTGATLVFRPVALADAGAYNVRITSLGPAGGGRAALARAVAFTPSFDVEPADRIRVVTRTADAGAGTLREALEAVEASKQEGVDGIRFALPPGENPVIRLTTGLPPITRKVRILGPSGGLLAVDGAGLHRPFFVDGGEVTLDNFRVVRGLAQGGNALGGGGGAAGMGGGLFLNQGALILRRMTFQDNKAQGGASAPGADGENGGGGGCGGDSPVHGGAGGEGGLLKGHGGAGTLDGTATTDAGGGPAVDGDGAGGGAVRGGLATTPLAKWADNLSGGNGTFGGGGGFSVGPLGGGGDGGSFGGGGGGSGGLSWGVFLPGAAGGSGGVFGGDGVVGDGLQGGRGGGGCGAGGALFFRRGSLELHQCAFLGNRALGGGGGEPGLGKGGAIFVYRWTEGGALDLKQLAAQTYQDNAAQDLVEDASFDNNDFYVAQTILAFKRGSPLDLAYRRYRLALKLGMPRELAR
jgi:hypothetical protein